MLAIKSEVLEHASDAIVRRLGSPGATAHFQAGRAAACVSQLLDSAHQYPVTVLIAGAGYGKSVALDHWLAGLTEDVVRYDVIEGTTGVFDFALGLAKAPAPKLRLSAKAAANAVNAAEKSTSPDLDLAAWLSNAARKFTGTIAIDDFHVAAAEDSAVARLLARTVERTGDRIRWIVSSRSASGLPITSWIAYGKSQMAIGERDLSFTHDEAIATCRVADTALTEAQLNELYAYTAGWPTALTWHRRLVVPLKTTLRHTCKDERRAFDLRDP